MNNNKAFEEWWGDRGERWNGVLDIKNFSREIWIIACEEKDKVIEKMISDTNIYVMIKLNLTIVD